MILLDLKIWQGNCKTQIIMYEMLANQYFMTGRYELACRTYEKVLSKRPKDHLIQRKLIICYSQVGKIEKALDIFISCLEEDIECIVSVDPVPGDCPCPDPVAELEKTLANNLNSLDFHLMLGMLWLYCDVEKSIRYFKKANEIDKRNKKVKKIISLLTAYQKQNNQKILDSN